MGRLSSLPNEILDDIFDLAHTELEPLTGPLSKRLLPFFQRSFYRKVRLSSYGQLDRLCQTSQTRPVLTSLIWVLRIEIPKERYSNELDLRRPTNDAIHDLLSRLVTLRYLRITGSSRVACLLLSPPSQTIYPFCSTLLYLELSSSFDPHRNPYQVLLHSTLHQYRSLESMHLNVDRSEATIDSGPDDIGSTDIPRQLSSSIGSFTLSGPLAESRCAETILGSVPAPFQIRIVHAEPSFPPFRELLSRVQQPRLVNNLHILASDSDRLGSHVFSPLRLFTQLRSIELSVRTTFEDVFLALSGAPLELIHLYWDCDVAITALMKLVTGSTKIKTLKEVVLDVVHGDRGRTIPRELARKEMAKWVGLKFHWEIPCWTDEFSRDGFEEFLALAKREGIKVTGDAVEALEIDDECEVEYYRSVLES